jgi:hypothetical protein
VPNPFTLVAVCGAVFGFWHIIQGIKKGGSEGWGHLGLGGIAFLLSAYLGISLNSS